MSYSITTYAVNESNQNFLQFMIKLVQKQLSTTWQLVNDLKADVILVDVDRTDGQTFWQNNQHNKTLIAFSWQNNQKNQWFLEKPLHKIQPFIALLNQLTQKLMPCFPLMTEVHDFQANWYLLGLVQETLYNNQPRRISCSNLPPFYILPAERRFFMKSFNPRDLSLTEQFLFGVQTIETQVTDITSEELITAVNKANLETYHTDLLL